MYKLILGLFVLAAGGAFAVFSATPACAGGQCGVMPIKPIPPIGCTDMQPVCQCDATGRSCAWTWVCVR